MIKAALTTITTLLVILFSGPGFAQKFEPSETSCQFYQDLAQEYQCTQTNYLNEASQLCEKYLAHEPQMNNEIQIFFPKIRRCLQEKLQEQMGPDFCDNLLYTSVDSHVYCYIEHGYCELSALSRAQLVWAIGRKLFKSPWLETGAKINQACWRQALIQ